jgi:hypothetical protein
VPLDNPNEHIYVLNEPVVVIDSEDSDDYDRAFDHNERIGNHLPAFFDDDGTAQIRYATDSEIDWFFDRVTTNGSEETSK